MEDKKNQKTDTDEEEPLQKQVLIYQHCMMFIKSNR